MGNIDVVDKFRISEKFRAKAHSSYISGTPPALRVQTIWRMSSQMRTGGSEADAPKLL
jgi:hypothetical protein